MIVDGEAEIDESMVTGESRPVAKSVGDRVVAGTVATDSAIRVRVEAVGDDTALAGIQRLVAEAQASRSRAQALADRAAGWLFYVAAGAGVVTFVVWMLVGDADEAVEHTVTVLVIACPHALGLAIPLVIALSTAVAARAGILVKDRLALERMREINAVLFDKTGTLTKGPARRHRRRGRTATRSCRRRSSSRSPARSSPTASTRWRARSSPRQRSAGRFRRRRGFRSITGRGVEATVDGARRRGRWPGAAARARRSSVPDDLDDRVDGVEGARRGGALRRPRTAPSSARSRSRTRSAPSRAKRSRELHDRGIRVVMITGDAQQVADAVGRDVGVDEVLAEVLPEDKDTQGRGAPGARAAGRDGRRRRERRARARTCRRRDRDRRRDRRRDRVGRASCSRRRTRAAWSA